MLLLLATAPIRALGQFSHLTFLLAITGAFMPSMAGTLLVGLSLMKPQIVQEMSISAPGSTSSTRVGGSASTPPCGI